VADIFVSYTKSDRDWAFWLAAELKELGHAPHIHEWEIHAGDDIYAWMEAHHEAADHVLCVVSDVYLKETNFYSQLERRAALWQAAGKRPGFALFVVVKPCRLPTLSDHYRRCELFDLPKDAARLRIREFMQNREASETIVFPGKVVAVSNIPIRVPTHFMGREEALAAVEVALGRYEGRVAITALHGLRGIGKTVLAAAYADLHRGGYRATWWIRAQSEPGMRADLVALGVRLGWVPPDEKEEPALAAVSERLRHEGEGILLIFDNATDADALKPYLPRGGSARVHLERAGLARRRRAGRNQVLAQGDRRRLRDRPHRPSRGARSGRRICRRCSAACPSPMSGRPPIASGSKSRSASTAGASRRRHCRCSTPRVTHRPSITTS
jgi:hypothetical protein